MHCKTQCPDGGTCHHECPGSCFRVRFCEPLSGVFPGDRWPVDIQLEHPEPEEPQPELPLYHQAWMCTCGHTNPWRHGSSDYRNEDGCYEVCGRCGFEVYDEDGPRHKLRLVDRLLLVPITRPWRAA